jgi:protein-tyrosine phosphatase
VIDGVVNLRELGGMRTQDGRTVRTGQLYRSGHLGSLADEGAGGLSDAVAAAFEHTGIATVFDLRTVAEVTRSPDQVPPGVQVVHLDVLADAKESIAAHLQEIFADPTSATRVFDDGVVDRHYESTYRNLVRLESARSAYHELFTTMSKLDHPVLFHCTAGKDRTGWAAASLLRLLGVDEDTVIEEYLRSNAPVLEGFAPYLQQFADMGGDPEVLAPAFLVQPSYLHAAFHAVREDYGDIEGYFERALGVDADARRRLRDRLLAA